MGCRALLEELAGRVGLVPSAALRIEDGMLLDGEAPVAPLQELLAEPVERTVVYHHRPTTAFDEKGQGDIHVSLVFGAERAVVEVDPDLGLDRANAGTFSLVPAKEMIEHLRRDYARMAGMIIGDPPEFDEVMASVADLEEELNR